ncbi:MAG: phage tail tape measure protein [Cycloclasticus sp.]
MDLIDRLTKPASRAFGKLDSLVKRSGQNIENFAHKAQRGFRNIAFGALGLVGAGHAIAGAMQPALEFNRSVGEIASLGVYGKELDSLKKSAFEFSNQYGESATEFVAASYDIQSAIGGLVNGELGAFTNASGVLAKATKSDVAVITDYVGTMYGIFAKQADAMGKADWVNQLAGQTASAVQMFKTTGSEMASAFSSVGAGATTAGVLMNEQMAILGTLQSTMSGSEAGTKYRAFLSGVGKAQHALGLEFTDSAGRMLPMVNILEAIKGKFGQIDTVAEADTLKKAFGTSEAVGLIQLLSANIGGLDKSIGDLGQQTGMQKAEEMAAAMVDPWDRFAASVRNLRIMMGDLLLPVLNPLMDRMAEGVATISKWSDMFPYLSKAVGFTALAVLGFVGVMALLSLSAGIAQIAWGGMVVLWTLLTPAIWLLKGALMGLKTAWFLLNVVAWAFPGFLIVAALVALGAGIYMVIKHWDKFTSALGDQGWFKAIVKGLGFVKNAFMNLANFIMENNPMAVMGRGLDEVKNKFSGWFGDDAEIEQTKKSVRETVSNVNVAGMGGGGIRQDIANNTSRGHSIENMTVVSPTAVNGFSLKDELEMI